MADVPLPETGVKVHSLNQPSCKTCNSVGLAKGQFKERKKTDKEKSHKGIWSDAPEASRDKLGMSQGHLGHLGLIYV